MKPKVDKEKAKVDWSLVAPCKMAFWKHPEETNGIQKDQYRRGVEAGWEARGEKLMRLAMDAIVEETERRSKKCDGCIMPGVHGVGCKNQRRTRKPETRRAKYWQKQIDKSHEVWGE